MSKIQKAIADSGVIVFTMKYKPDFPMDFLYNSNPFGTGRSALFGDIVHPDDYQPFCEILSDLVSRHTDTLTANVRMTFDNSYQWFYISAVPEFKKDGCLKEINGVMYNVSAYLDTGGDDAVMRGIQGKMKAAFDSAEHAPQLPNILGMEYLQEIQQPFTLVDGLYSAIVDVDGKMIAVASGQDENVNLNKMSYQRKKSIRIKHQNAASWVIASESPQNINKCAPLLDTMVQTVSELANSYIVISEEMENSQNANKMLGQNFEDQILINNIYSLIVRSKNTSTAFASIIPLIKEYFALDELMFCADAQRPIKAYRWDESGALIPVIANEYTNKYLDNELDNDAVVCIKESDYRETAEKDRSMALSRVYENGSSRGVLVFISEEPERAWTNRDRKIIRSITQIISTVIYRSFMENELAVSQEHLLRLAYYNTTTGIPNRSAFERDFRENISNGGIGAIVSIEIANLKTLSETYSARYADEIMRSIAEYISAINTDKEKHIYMFTNDILFVTMIDAKREDAVSLAMSILQKFRTPWFLNDSENRLEIYAGVCLFPEDADGVEDAVSFATKTLRLAKDRKLQDPVSYSGDIEEKLDENQRIKKLIMGAMENGFDGFYYLYTPIMDVNDGSLVACEAHLFWSDGDIIVPREKFLPTIVRMNLQMEFHDYALGRLCEMCAKVRESGLPNFTVNYTIPDYILNSEIGTLVLNKKLKEYSLPTDAIGIVISESDRTLLANSSGLKLRAKLGAPVIADDKGETFFSGDILDNPYINTVKIRARRLNDDPVSSGFVRSLIDRAHEKNIKVCIKGVDNEKSLEYARRFNADMYQGIVNCRPLHSTEFISKMVAKR